MKSNFNDIINEDKYILVDFYATWCGPCKTLAPILVEVKAAMGESLKVITIDVDKNEILASKYQVKGVPTLLLFKSGKQLWRQSGLFQKNELISIITSFIEE
ncbi:MAG: thioredoxin [Flavobacteriales bacterium]|nr:thioredoxin [Flavobacteriales bacterium]